MFLLRAVVLTGPRDVQTECISIKLQARLGIADDDCGMIDSQKQLVLVLPLLIALAFRKLQNLEPVLIRIAKVESLDAAGVLVPVRQTLWTGRSVFDLVLAQQCVSLIHVAGDDGNVLKPAIVTA